MSTEKKTPEYHLQPVLMWIRGEVPEIGSKSLMVTRSEFEAMLWRSQGHKTTQVFHYYVQYAR